MSENIDTKNDFRYWAFLSYSSADAAVAKKLHRDLERFKIPRLDSENPDFEIPLRIFPIFRDRDELALSSDLGEQLRQSLRQSRNLIVLCSPSAAKSDWVNEEIRYFKSLGRSDRIFAVILDGDPNLSGDQDTSNECFPPAIRASCSDDDETNDSIEPIAGDLRPNGDGWQMVLLKAIAAILGVRLGELVKRDEKARTTRRRVVTTCCILSLLVLMAGIYYVIQANRATHTAEQQKHTAVQQRLDAERQKTHEAATVYWQRALQSQQTRPIYSIQMAASVVEEFDSRAAVANRAHLIPDSNESNAARRLITQPKILLRWHSPSTQHHSYEIQALAISQNGSQLASGDAVGIVRLWDFQSGQLLKEFGFPSNGISSLAFGPEGSRLWVGHRSSRLSRIELSTGEKKTIDLETDPFRHARIESIEVPIGSSYVIACDDISSFYLLDSESLDIENRVRNGVFETLEGTRIAGLRTSYPYWFAKPSIPNVIAFMNSETDQTDSFKFDSEIKSLAIADQGSDIFVGLDNSTLVRFNVENKSNEIVRKDFSGKLVRNSVGANFIVSVFHTQMIAFPRDGGEPLELKQHEGSINAVAIHGDILVSAGSDRYIRVWDLKNNELTNPANGLSQSIAGFAIHDNRRFDVATKLGTVLQQNGSQYERPFIANGLPDDCALSVDGKVLATAFPFGGITCWDLETQTRIVDISRMSIGDDSVSLSVKGNIWLTQNGIGAKSCKRNRAFRLMMWNRRGRQA